MSKMKKQKELSKNYIDVLIALKKDVEDYKKELGGSDVGQRYKDYKAQFKGEYDIYGIC